MTFMIVNGMTSAARTAEAARATFRVRPWLVPFAFALLFGAVAFWWAMDVDPTFYVAVYGAIGLMALAAVWLRRDPAGHGDCLWRLAILQSLYFHGVFCAVYLWNRRLFEPKDYRHGLAFLAIASVATSIVLWRARRGR